MGMLIVTEKCGCKKGGKKQWDIWMDGQTDRQMDGIQRDRWIDRLTDQRTDGLNGWMDKWQIDRQMNGRMGGQTDE